jgi:hypothetical protein
VGHDRAGHHARTGTDDDALEDDGPYAEGGAVLDHHRRGLERRTARAIALGCTRLGVTAPGVDGEGMEVGVGKRDVVGDEDAAPDLDPLRAHHDRTDEGRVVSDGDPSLGLHIERAPRVDVDARSEAHGRSCLAPDARE